MGAYFNVHSPLSTFDKTAAASGGRVAVAFMAFGSTSGGGVGLESSGHLMCGWQLLCWAARAMLEMCRLTSRLAEGLYAMGMRCTACMALKVLVILSAQRLVL